MNSAMAIEVLMQYEEMLRAVDSPSPQIAAVTQVRDDLLTALTRSAWNGTAGWFRRAWLGEGNGLGWLGDDGLWLEPNAWALLSAVTDAINVTQQVWQAYFRKEREIEVRLDTCCLNGALTGCTLNGFNVFSGDSKHPALQQGAESYWCHLYD